MNCEQTKLEIGADPATTAQAVQDHLATCVSCTQFQREMAALDTSIRRAVRQLPPATAGTATWQAAASKYRALAASVAVAALGFTLLWTLRPTESLAHDVAAHVELESHLSDERFTPAAAALLTDALRQAGMDITLDSNEIISHRWCQFRAHRGWHFIVQTSDGAITVMMLPEEEVTQPRTFNEEGLSGVLLPAAAGSVAILASEPAELDAFAERLRQKTARIGAAATDWRAPPAA